MSSTIGCFKGYTVDLFVVTYVCALIWLCHLHAQYLGM